MDGIDDSEVLLLASIAASLEGSYVQDAPDPWEGSPFGWIRTQPSRRVGKIGEQLVSGWCAAHDFDVTRSGDSQADRVIHGYRTEIKFSTLWENGGYKFQQIRDQDYEHLFCLGIGPLSAHAWVVPKSELLERVIGRMGQHTGRSASDTAWLGFAADNPYPWMAQYGGSLSEALGVLNQLPHGNRKL